MNETIFRKEAKAYFCKIIGLFVVVVVVQLVCLSISNWAARFHGWQANAVSIVFYLLFGVLGLIMIVNLMLIYAFFKVYPAAKRNACQYQDNADAFRRIYREVVEPIPWK